MIKGGPCGCLQGRQRGQPCIGTGVAHRVQTAARVRTRQDGFAPGSTTSAVRWSPAWSWAASLLARHGAVALKNTREPTFFRFSFCMTPRWLSLISYLMCHESTTSRLVFRGGKDHGGKFVASSAYAAVPCALWRRPNEGRNPLAYTLVLPRSRGKVSHDVNDRTARRALGAE